MFSYIGELVFFGWFINVKNKEERSGSIFCQIGALLFNWFIEDVGLMDVPLEVRRFLWASFCGEKEKLSKLDRFRPSNSMSKV